MASRRPGPVGWPNIRTKSAALASPASDSDGSGALILTLAVTLIEVMSISAMTTHGADNPALVRDTIFAVIMILLNGMVGISLLLGGWRHREQHYNLQGANTYLGLIIPLAVLSLIMPDLPKGVEAKGFGVTIEDEGGAQTPTKPIIMAGF